MFQRLQKKKFKQEKSLQSKSKLELFNNCFFKGKIFIITEFIK